MERILIIGANGQIGSELVTALAEQHGAAKVLATDIGASNVYGAARYAQLDVLDKARLMSLVEEEGVTQVYQLAALLSATGEQAPLRAWSLNMDGLLNILEVGGARRVAGKPQKIFFA
jgi:nucleoside-diphosphate-sugar epimerase